MLTWRHFVSRRGLQPPRAWRYGSDNTATTPAKDVLNRPSGVVAWAIYKLRTAELQTYPFEYAIVPVFLAAESARRINATYPSITKGGSYPIESLDAGMTIKEGSTLI